MTFPDPSQTEEISVTDASALIDNTQSSYVLIDCREPEEYEICHLEGADLAPLSNFEVEAEILFASEEEPALVYCHHGGRSLKAARWLREKGYPNVFSMKGGIEKWSLEIDDTVPRY